MLGEMVYPPFSSAWLNYPKAMRTFGVLELESSSPLACASQCWCWSVGYLIAKGAGLDYTDGPCMEVPHWKVYYS